MMRIIVCVALLLAVIPAYVSSAPVITIVNNRLFLDGVEFIVKGVDYSPAPIGQKGMSGGYGGTGFCSPKVTPWNEWKSACYDSDYFDGSPDPWTPSRFPTGFKPLWERDFPYIKAIGANTIRLYNTNPSTLAATKEYKNLFLVPSGKDHTQFVKYCEDNNLKIVYPLFPDENSFLNLDENIFRRYLRWQIDEVGNSSAILVWQLGNEQGWSWYGASNTRWNNSDYTAKLNRMVNYIRTYTKTRWNRFIPVTSTIPNTFLAYNYMFQNWAVDIFTTNVFSLDYTSLANGNSQTLGIGKLGCYYNKPFLMTETGRTPAAGQGYNIGDIPKIWYQTLLNNNNNFIGAIWFEQTDEPSKGKDFGLFSLNVTITSTGARSDQQDVFVPDTVYPKDAYTDISSGSFNNMPYNFKTDHFATLLQRTPYTSSNVPDVCATKYTLKSCPGSGTPRCSGNGVCDRTTGTCNCLAGYSGSSCSTASCSCNGRGVCNTAVYPIECACNTGYWGSSCQYSVQAGVCPALNNMNCTNGNGVCVGGVCQCHSGWTGPDCGVTDPGFGSINIQQNYYACLSTATFSVMAPNVTTLTNQGCRYYCASRGYTYAATTNGNVCQCGSSITSTATSTSCSVNCVGDAKQRCGGKTQKSVYYAGPLAATGYIGCFVDNATRDLPSSNSAGSGTVDKCRKACGAAGFAYSGSQNGAECWCGNTYGNTGGKAPDTDCSSACSGDNTVKCGAGWRNSVYTTALPVGYQFYP